jgi:hypothetical protein
MTGKIPKKIFQTCPSLHISSEFQTMLDTWKQFNKEYEIELYDDVLCEAFILKEYGNPVYNVFKKLIPGAFKSHLWSYCVLYKYGGFYAAADTMCYRSIADCIDDSTEFITSIDACNSEYLYHLSNNFIGSIAEHPILKECIDRIVYNVENNVIHRTMLDLTGSGILGKATNAYINLHETSSFIGKHGKIAEKNIKLLLFIENGTLAVDTDTDHILFQNKKWNSYIQYIYKREMSKIENWVNWKNCSRPIKPSLEPTIITMLYDIRKKEATMNNEDPFNSKFNRRIEQYFNYAEQFVLTLPYNMVIFTDDDPNVSNFILNKRREFGLEDKTQLNIVNIEDTYFYKHLTQLKELYDTFEIINGHKEHETPLYIILNNNKFHFIEHVLNENPFGSERFLYIDIGIIHVAKHTERIHDWIYEIPAKIKQLCINPFLEHGEYRDVFKYIYHHTAGGLFSGSKENLLKYSKLFKEKTEKIYQEGWYQIDEAVMTIVQRENPDLFEFFYGDYTGIVSNYVKPCTDMDLITKGCKKCIDYNNVKFAYHITRYMYGYFIEHIDAFTTKYSSLSSIEKGEPEYESHLLTYIASKIIVDFYNNNGYFTDDLLTIVKKIVSVKNENEKLKARTLSLLNANKLNLQFYINKYSLLTYV